MAQSSCCYDITHENNIYVNSWVNAYAVLCVVCVCVGISSVARFWSIIYDHTYRHLEVFFVTSHFFLAIGCWLIKYINILPEQMFYKYTRACACVSAHTDTFICTYLCIHTHIYTPIPNTSTDQPLPYITL